MRRGRRDSAPNLSLFPFLAVLLGTMGILVLWLFVSVRLAGSQAREKQIRSQSETQARIEELVADSELAAIRVEGWTEQRKKLLEQAHSLRVQQAELLRQIETIQAETGLLREQQQLAAGDREKKAAADLALENSLKQQLQELQQALAEQEAIRGSLPVNLEPVMYSIVPHAGNGGTSRRPIYVECQEKTVVLQPLGIRLEESDFLETEMPGNPLDAALGEIRDYWIRNDVAGSEGRPYPLLVVRPDGPATYAAARRAMQGWSDEFGYELVAAEMPLDFGESDPELKLVVEQAIHRSRELMARYHQQMEMQRQAARQARAAQSDPLVTGLRASRAGGGFVSSGGTQAGRERSHSAAGTGPAANPRGTASHSGSPAAVPAASFRGGAEPPAARAPGIHSPPAESSVAAGPGGEKAGSTGPEPGGNAAFASTGTSPFSGDPSAAASAGSPQADAGAHAPSGTEADEKGVAASEGGSADSDADANCPCLADRRGEEWAVKRGPNQRTGYVRPVTVWCDSQKMEVDPGASSWLAMEPVRFESNPVESADRLVSEINKVVSSWGSPPEYGYWRPELRIRVVAGGEKRVQNLRRLLDGSGFTLPEEH